MKVENPFYKKSVGDLFNRRLIQNKTKELTLIIGAVCREGVVLVGDTKIVDPSRNVEMHENKILLPLYFPLAVGAAGLTDLSQRFNRRLPVIVDTRLREYRIKNEAELMKIGRSISEFEQEEETQTLQSTEDLRTVPEKKTKPLFELPYVYNFDDFLTDCRNLLRQIADEGRRFSNNPIEVLISFKAENPVLFHIDSDGLEKEVTSYHAIGSGGVFVDMFFRRMWKKRTLFETIALSTLIIKFVQDLQLDNFVGLEDKKMPQVVVLLKNGKWGELSFRNTPDFLKSISGITAGFGQVIEYTSLPKIELAKDYSID